MSQAPSDGLLSLMRALEAQQQPGLKPGLAAALLGGAPAPQRGGLGLLNSSTNIPMASSTRRCPAVC